MSGRVRRLARACLPEAMVARYGTTRLAWRARTLSTRASAAVSAEDRVDAIWSFDEFRPYQKKSELLAFLNRVEPLRASAICEIGAASGGTLCALSHAADDSAIVISIDRDFTPARLKALPNLGRGRQSLTCIAGDSHSTDVQSRVAAILGGRPLDVLFIDGDHTAAGVRADFDAYCGFVRPGGVIAFHDIVADFKTRFGRPTAADSGGVPQFWQELRQRYTTTQEFVESSAQDGYGIGLLAWPG
jgi:predicted O-methyltransferase YrrM